MVQDWYTSVLLPEVFGVLRLRLVVPLGGVSRNTIRVAVSSEVYISSLALQVPTIVLKLVLENRSAKL